MLECIEWKPHSALLWSGTHSRPKGPLHCRPLAVIFPLILPKREPSTNGSLPDRVGKGVKTGMRLFTKNPFDSPKTMHLPLPHLA